MWNLGEQRLRAAQGVAAEGEEQAAGRLGVDGLAAPQRSVQLQDRAVLELDASLRCGEPVDPEAASRLLFAFCRDALRRAQALLP